MSSPPSATFLFTKLIVDDLEKVAVFYREAYGLSEIERIQGEIASDPIDEIMLGVAGEFSGGLILLKYTEKPKPQCGEVILGVTTDDIEALYQRIQAAGGCDHQRHQRTDLV